jgi:glutathione S-transferase
MRVTRAHLSDSIRNQNPFHLQHYNDSQLIVVKDFVLPSEKQTMAIVKFHWLFLLLLTVENAESWFTETKNDFPLQKYRGGGGSPLQPLQFFIFVGGLCPFAGRTWIVLGELEIEFEFCYIDFQEKPKDFLRVNPRGRVPALYNPNDGTTVYESAICNEYLCDLVMVDFDKASTLMPSSASDRSKLRLLNDRFDKNIFPKVRAYIMAEYNKDNHDEGGKESLRSLRQDCEDALTELQEMMSNGPYLMGDTFTVADAHVVPFVMRWIVQLKQTKDFNLSKKYRKIKKWYALCQQRASVKAATIPESKIIEVHYAKLKYLKQLENKNK